MSITDYAERTTAQYVLLRSKCAKTKKMEKCLLPA